MKDAVKAILHAYRPYVYGHWPVPYMNATMLDYHGCCCGLYFAVECKRDDTAQPTPRQLLVMQNVDEALGHTFVVRSTDGQDIAELDAWLHHVVMQHKAKLHHAHPRRQIA